MYENFIFLEMCGLATVLYFMSLKVYKFPLNLFSILSFQLLMPLELRPRQFFSSIAGMWKEEETILFEKQNSEQLRVNGRKEGERIFSKNLFSLCFSS